MPVSRKRKKKAKGRGSWPAARVGASVGFSDHGEVRRRLDERRIALATIAAEELVAELVDLAGERDDAALEDDLCTRSGPLLWEWSSAPVADHVNPPQLAKALLSAADAAVHKALGEPDAWLAAWRVFVAVARTLPHPLHDDAVEMAALLRTRPGGEVLPELPDGPRVTGEVWWARDGYGSRFAVVAEMEGTDRWYLWDIDACGLKSFTVHSGYFATRDDAFDDWCRAVGPVAAGPAALGVVDDAALLAELLPAEEGVMRVGGEDAGQFAEYHRSRRLAEAVLDAVDAPAPGLDDASAYLATKEAAARDFAAWLRRHRAGQPQPDDLDELAGELATSWGSYAPPALYRTCSPHRVAQTALSMEDFYADDFAARLTALLPDWTDWLAASNGTAPELAERCRPYTTGEPYPGTVDDRGLNPMVRVAE